MSVSLPPVFGPSAADSKAIAFKVVLQHSRGQVTRHRFRGDFSYAEMLQLLSFLWGGKKNLVVEYTDEDGDDIIVLTDLEWRECVRLHQQKVERSAKGSPTPALDLRVRKAVVVKRGKAAKEASAANPNAPTRSTLAAPAGEVPKKRSAPEGSGSDSDDAVEYVNPSSVTASVAGSELPAARPVEVPGNVSGDSVTTLGAADTPADEEGAAENDNDEEEEDASKPSQVAVEPPTYHDCCHATCAVPRLHLSAVARQRLQAPRATYVAPTPFESAVLSIVSLLFSCNAEVELFNDDSAVDMTSVVRRTREANGDVHVDFDMPALRRCVITEANRKMESGAYLASQALLQQALQVFLEDCIMEYNLACAHSLAADYAPALAYLTKALEHGYRDMDMVVSDDDLANIRGMPEFRVLLEQYFPEVREQFVLVPSAAEQAAEASSAAAAQQRVCSIPVSEPADVVVTAPAQQPPEPAQPTSSATCVAPPPFTPRTGTMLNIFPSMTTTEAQQLLQLAKGNMNLAVQWKLGSI